MATRPALVLSRDEVVQLLLMLGADPQTNYGFGREQYKEWRGLGSLNVLEQMQDIARYEPE